MPLALSFLMMISGRICGVAALEHGDEKAGLGTCFFVVEMCEETGMSARTLEMIRLEVDKIYEQADVEIVWLNCQWECPRSTDSAYEATVYVRRRLPEPLQKSGKALGIDLTECGQPPGPVIVISKSAIETFIGRRRSMVAEAEKAKRTLRDSELRDRLHGMAYGLHKSLAHSKRSIPGRDDEGSAREP
jgi:hypothetical protein